MRLGISTTSRSSVPLWPVYLVAGAVCLALTLAAKWLVSSREMKVFLDGVNWTLSSGMATLLLGVAWQRERGDRRSFLWWMLCGFLSLFIGQCIYDAQAVVGVFSIPDPATIAFLVRPVLITVAIRWLIPGRRRAVSVPVVFDTIAFTLLLLTIVLAVYLPVRVATSGYTFATLVAYPAIFFALSAMTVLALLERHERLKIAAVALGAAPFAIGVCWTAWNTRLLQNDVPAGALLGLAFSLVNLIWSAAAVYWRPGRPVSIQGDRWFSLLNWLLPVALMIAAIVALVIVVETEPVERDLMGLCLVGVIIFAMFRQGMLLRRQDLLIQTEADAQRFREQILGIQRLEIVGTVAAGVAHDLNNLLTIVLMNSETARSSRTASERDECLENLAIAVQHARGTVKRILDFSSNRTTNRKSVSAKSLLADVQRLLTAGVPNRHTVIVQVEEGLPELPCAPAQLFQVLMNLGLNASHAIGPEAPGTIEFQVRRTPYAPEADVHRALEISVKDSGHGMAADVLARAFDPFFTTKPKGVGTGLGLTTVRDIVTEHGGTISVQSEPGKGTTFTIRLPAEPSTPPQVAGGTTTVGQPGRDTAV